MNSKYQYIGCFLSQKEVLSYADGVSTGHLFRIITIPHVTFVFEPDDVDESLFGEKIRVEATGYGNNGRNEGLSVKLYSENRVLADMIERIEIPHITISVGEGGRPYDTKFLKFRPIEPFELEGVFGGYMRNGTAVYSKPDIF